MNLQKIKAVTVKKLRPAKAFTLVELVVVITILAILGTIGFLSVGGYSSRARDSGRLADVANISKSLDLSIVTVGNYPAPDNSFAVTYSGSAVWNQGIVGTTVLQTFRSSVAGGGLNKKPVDPLDGGDYVYSSLAEGKAYQVMADYEGDISAYRIAPVIEDAYAAPGNPTISYIKGNYGGIAAKVSSGSTVYVLALPSIITSTGTVAGGKIGIDIGNTLSGTLLFHGKSLRGSNSYNPNSVAYSGVISTTNPSGLPNTSTGITALISQLQNTYSGSDVRGLQEVSTLLSTPASSFINFGNSVIKNQLGGSATSWSVPENQETPAYAFSSHTFTNCGVTWKNGPAISTCKSAYSSAAWANTYLAQGPFNGYQRWTVPSTARYRFTAVGAAGSAPSSSSYEWGKPAKLVVEVNLSKGQEIDIVVGQHTSRSAAHTYNGNAGGGTFVVKKDFWLKSTNADRDTTIIVVAWGGANGNYSSTAQSYTNANYNSTSGKDSSNGWTGGANWGTSTNSASCGNSWAGGPGAGMYQDSSASSFTLCGGASHAISFLNGAIGATGYYSGHQSGFGGGGAGGNHGWAGGGGYSGGAGASSNSYYAGGGGSYWANSTLISAGIDSTADTLEWVSGYVTVEKL